MENHFPFHHLSELENMLINIQAEGQQEVLHSIEEEKDAIKRFKKRNLFYTALNKLKGGK